MSARNSPRSSVETSAADGAAVVEAWGRTNGRVGKVVRRVGRWAPMGAETEEVAQCRGHTGGVCEGGEVASCGGTIDEGVVAASGRIRSEPTDPMGIGVMFSLDAAVAGDAPKGDGL